MTSTYDAFRKSIRSTASKFTDPELGAILDAVELELDELAQSGIVKLGEDHRLSGIGLEIRTRLLLQDMGYTVRRRRKSMEDLVVDSDETLSPDKPICIEVKSSRKPQISRSSLRQLDDWVFDLSGEELARKQGLGGGIDPLALITQGMRTRKKHHPSPHKGVMVFNGPVGVPFDQRDAQCVGANDLEFVEKRDFCIIPIDVLLAYAEQTRSGEGVQNQLWERIHLTAGVLGPELRR